MAIFNSYVSLPEGILGRADWSSNPRIRVVDWAAARFSKMVKL